MYLHHKTQKMENEIKILYAEDNTTAALIYQEILEEAGFTVTIASTGNEAWDLYQNGKWDLILLDMDLPGKDGHELIRLIREQGDQVPIIILSSLNHNHALYEGADDYLVKGCSVDEVKARIDKAIARTRRINTEKEQGLFHLSPSCRNPSLLPKPLSPAETNGGPRERVRRFVVRMPASRLRDYSTSQVAPERSRSSTQ